MGLSLSLLSKLGVPGVSSLTTDQIYERFFKQAQKFDEFHTAFIDLCKFFNDVMPGKHFVAPTIDEIKKFYDDEWAHKNESDKKDRLNTYVQENVKILKPNDNAIIIAGMVVPAAATVLKNNVENMPPVKRFKLHLVPNFVFVPTVTLIALGCVQLMQFSKKKNS